MEIGSNAWLDSLVVADEKQRSDSQSRPAGRGVISKIKLQDLPASNLPIKLMVISCHEFLNFPERRFIREVVRQEDITLPELKTILPVREQLRLASNPRGVLSEEIRQLPKIEQLSIAWHGS